MEHKEICSEIKRTITGIVGVTACAMLIVCSLGMLNSMNYFIDLQFNRIFNFDYKLSIKSNINNNELKDLTDKYGIIHLKVCI